MKKIADFIINVYSKMYKTQEGKIFKTGMALLVIYIIIILTSIFWNPGKIEELFGMTIAHVFFGRAAGISSAHSLNIGNFETVFLNLFIETILVFLLYPLLVLSIEKALVLDFLKGYVEQIKSAAEKHNKSVRKYGIISLLFFVWLPFWMTGPIIGSIIGRLIGLNVFLNFSIVISGTFLAIISWTYLIDKVATFVPQIGIIILLILALVFLFNKFKPTDRK